MNYVKPVYKAVIPVAGLGTRMLLATKAIPKELLPIYDRPLIEDVVKEATDVGICEIIFITRSWKEAIENHFDVNFELEHRLIKKGKNKILEDIVEIIPDGVKISSIWQHDALGLGHAVLCAKASYKWWAFCSFANRCISVRQRKKRKNSSFTQLVNAWNNTGISQIMVEQIDFDCIDKYGMINPGEKKIDLFETTFMFIYSIKNNCTLIVTLNLYSLIVNY